MARGNQRDLAREKNLKKKGQEKSKKDGDPTKRKENDAEIMRLKQVKAAEKKAADEAAGK